MKLALCALLAAAAAGTGKNVAERSDKPERNWIYYEVYDEDRSETVTTIMTLAPAGLDSDIGIAGRGIFHVKHIGFICQKLETVPAHSCSTRLGVSFSKSTGE